jgi:glycerol kinase
VAKFILAIDQGTTGSTVALMDEKGVLRGSVNYEFPQLYPKPGWVEHRPADIWASVEKGIRAILRKKICKPSDIAVIGITNQRETALLWDKRDGKALNNAIVWQCRRTTDFCESLRSSGHENTIRRKSGLVLDPYFSASKYRWLLKNTPGISRLVKSGRVAAGTIDSFLIWHLSVAATPMSPMCPMPRVPP